MRRSSARIDGTIGGVTNFSDAQADTISDTLVLSSLTASTPLYLDSSKNVTTSAPSSITVNTLICSSLQNSGLTASTIVCTDASKVLTSTVPASLTLNGVVCSSLQNSGLTASGAVFTDASKNLTSTAPASITTNGIYASAINVSGLTGQYPVFTDGSKNLTNTCPTTISFYNVLPLGDFAYNLGSSGMQWSSLYVQSVIPRNSELIIQGSFRPSTSLTRSLGTSSYKWNTLYTKNITDDATNVFIGGTTGQSYIGRLPDHTSTYSVTGGCILVNTSTSETGAVVLSGNTTGSNYLMSGNSRVTGGSTSTYGGVTYYRKYILYSNGDIENYTGVYGTISDVTLKQDISPARDYLTDVCQLQVKKYNLIGEDDIDTENPKYLGLIAQEVETIFPNLVKTDPETGKKSIKVSILTFMMIKCIQELNQKISVLEDALAGL